jgi:hypothetical protein
LLKVEIRNLQEELRRADLRAEAGLLECCRARSGRQAANRSGVEFFATADRHLANALIRQSGV